LDQLAERVPLLDRQRGTGGATYWQCHVSSFS
jgi:hypothetical protein